MRLELLYHFAFHNHSSFARQKLEVEIIPVMCLAWKGNVAR